MEITRFGPDDEDRVAAYASVRGASREHDAPWEHRIPVTSIALHLQHGWDGETDTPYVATVDGEPVAVGSISTSEWDNRHLAWFGVHVHPEQRRRGYGSELLTALIDEARAQGRTTVGADGWESEQTRAFAQRHGFEVGSVMARRGQVLADVDWPSLEAAHADARERAAAYDVTRRAGRTPDDELAEVATMSESINDAPLDDLDREDEAYPPERVRDYEVAQEAQGRRLYRVLARHRDSGELAGHTVVAVDGLRPEHAEQHDTTVVARHRGHRLGLLLKADMCLWLREAEPQLIDVATWNSASNDHMVGVNEQLGYRLLGRQLALQRTIQAAVRS